MAYQETTRTGYGKRVSGSLGGILTGLLLIVGGTALLWWNEGRAVKTDKMLKEAESVTVELPDIQKLDSEYEGKLVHATGLAATQDSLVDPVFSIGAKCVALIREVELYQWVEEASSESKDKFGGAEETTTTYTYQQEWTTVPVNSQNFKDPAYKGLNFTLRQVESEQWWAENVSFGAYQLPASLIQQMTSDKPFYPEIGDDLLKQWNRETERAAGVTASVDAPKPTMQPEPKPAQVVEKSDSTKTADSTAVAIPSEPVPADASDVAAEDNLKPDYPYVHVSGNELYFGKNPARPQVGDVKVSFKVVEQGTVSIIAAVSGNTFKPFKAKNGKTFSTLSQGVVSAEDMYAGAHSGNKFFLWVFRILGFILISGGLKSVFNILETLLKVIPFLANIVGWGVRLVCNIIALVWTLVVIALAWLFYRPVIGILLLVIAGALVWLFAFKGKDKVKEFAARKTNNDN